jgi:hypothetical protein
MRSRHLGGARSKGAEDSASRGAEPLRHALRRCPSTVREGRAVAAVSSGPRRACAAGGPACGLSVEWFGRSGPITIRTATSARCHVRRTTGGDEAAAAPPSDVRLALRACAAPLRRSGPQPSYSSVHCVLAAVLRDPGRREPVG